MVEVSEEEGPWENVQEDGRMRYERCGKLAPDTELEGGSKEERKFEEGDRGGQGHKTRRSTTEKNESNNPAVVKRRPG